MGKIFRCRNDRIFDYLVKRIGEGIDFRFLRDVQQYIGNVYSLRDGLEVWKELVKVEI